MIDMLSSSPIETRVRLAVKEIFADGKLHRGVFASRLAEFGIVTTADQFAFSDTVALDPSNAYGRILVINRTSDQIFSPVNWSGRGRESGLGETHIEPHVEILGSMYEILRLEAGRAFLVKHSDKGEPTDIIDMSPHKDNIIWPGEVHSVLCVSKVVRLWESKLVPNTNAPRVTLDFVNRLGIQEGGQNVKEYLDKMHKLAETWQSQ